ATVIPRQLVEGLIHTDLATRTRAFEAVRQMATGTVAPPTAPAGLVAGEPSGDATRADISWGDLSSNEAGFQLWRRAGPGGYALRALIPANVHAYADSGLAAGSTYGYKVLAFNPGGTSAFSAEASVAAAAGG